MIAYIPYFGAAFLFALFGYWIADTAGFVVFLILGCIASAVNFVNDHKTETESSVDERIKKSVAKDWKKPKQKANLNLNPVSDDGDFFKLNRDRQKRYRNAETIDEIQFEYVTYEGNRGTYTVQAYKGLRGNIEGYCVERDDIRTFVPDRIVDSTVIRTETGEILTLKEWRALFRAN